MFSKAFLARFLCCKRNPQLDSVILKGIPSQTRLFQKGSCISNRRPSQLPLFKHDFLDRVLYQKGNSQLESFRVLMNQTLLLKMEVLAKSSCFNDKSCLDILISKRTSQLAVFKGIPSQIPVLQKESMARFRYCKRKSFLLDFFVLKGFPS